MQPITMTLPLRGEWMTPNTPGSRVPSHGTDLFGARYAYDFIQVDWTRRGLPAYRGSLARYLFRGVAVEDYYCWDAPVYAPCDGVVVVAKDGWLERPRTNLRADVRNAYRNATRFNPRCDDVRMIAGNYVIIQYAERVFAALCHLRMGSVAVASGQRVNTGELLGRVGHSGNSYMPHLHFQLMDHLDIAVSHGLPCVFATYEVWRNGAWQCAENAMPRRKERIRFVQNIAEDFSAKLL